MYLIRFLDVIRPLVSILSKMTRYDKNFKGQNNKLKPLSNEWW